MSQAPDSHRQRLEQARRRLHEEIHAELIEAGDRRAADVAETVRDVGDASVVDLVAELEYSAIDRHLNELRAVEQALHRIELGTYGRCVRCGQPIGEGRLEANPAAERCIDCQALWERETGSGVHPSL